MEKKISSSIETLCKGFPDEIPAFIHYTRDLKFDDRPDYNFLKRLFKTIMEKEKYELDNEYDWYSIKKSDVNKEEGKNYILIIDREKIGKRKRQY